MRIIAGEFRGRKLLPPPSDATRPITDRAKQSLFDILTTLIPDSIVYDCFAGTGSMGLESLSRGASKTVFFEQDRSAVQTLRKNIEAFGVGDRSTVVSDDLFKWFESAKTRPAEASLAELVFLDPPYRFVREKPHAIQALVYSIVEFHLKPGGTIIFRHEAADQLELASLTRYDQREYGQMMIEFLRPRT